MEILYLIPVWFALALAIPIAVALGGEYLRSRKQRNVTCPETAEFAVIQMDPRHAALMCALGEPLRRIQTCSRWPEKRDCGQACLREIGAAA